MFLSAMFKVRLFLALLLPLLLYRPAAVFSETVRVAVAANFKRPFSHLATLFEKQSGHAVVVSSGSTGKLYAQIRNGAPYHLFLSADSRRPHLLEQEGLTVPGSRFTYALGRLVLWSPDSSHLSAGEKMVRHPALTRLALANSKVAPYGVAAREVLQSLGLWQVFAGKMVFGENVGQVLAFVHSGNAQAGFVALSQLLGSSPISGSGRYWLIPDERYQPLRQDGVLLRWGQPFLPARALHAFLQSPLGLAEIKRLGYRLP